MIRDFTPLAFWLCYALLLVLAAIWIYRAAIR